MLDTLKDYDEDDQKSIIRTLTAVQKKGWNHGQDPFQFYIILGSVIREKETKVKELEEALEQLKDQNEEKTHKIHKLKDDLKNGIIVNEEMENELEQIEQKNREAENKLELKNRELSVVEYIISKQVEEINILNDDTKSMVSQISENVMLEKQVETQKNMIAELQ